MYYSSALANMVLDAAATNVDISTEGRKDCESFDMRWHTAKRKDGKTGCQKQKYNYNTNKTAVSINDRNAKKAHSSACAGTRRTDIRDQVCFAKKHGTLDELDVYHSDKCKHRHVYSRRLTCADPAMCRAAHNLHISYKNVKSVINPLSGKCKYDEFESIWRSKTHLQANLYRFVRSDGSIMIDEALLAPTDNATGASANIISVSCVQRRILTGLSPSIDLIKQLFCLHKTITTAKLLYQ